jgi:hypothetical protein
MRSFRFRRRLLWLATCLLITVACSQLPLRYEGGKSAPTAKLTASEQIAGEIMAYLMEVVLGQAGNPQGRSEWASRGRDLPLDFALVKNRLFGPVPLRAELMVLDTDILGLSEVLYHYDRRLNLFKGSGEHDSLYPCAELMAIRLLLVHKLNRGEKVNMAAIIRNKALFAPGSRAPRPEELTDMNLTDTEFGFLKEVLQSEPAFLRYMEHPFLVSTLKRIGVAEQDTLTLLADQMANYRQWSAPVSRALGRSPVTIAILPSMNALFEPSNGRIVPSTEYRLLVAGLEQAILTGLEHKGRQAAPAAARFPQPAFITPWRPMVIHPENAGRVVEEVCPQADFVVIVLGKNVYRTINIDPETDIYPHEPRIYLDVSDIRYQQIEDEIDTIVDAVLPKLTAAVSNQPS